MNELRKPIKGEMEKKFKEKMYSEIYDSASYLAMNHNYLPKSIGKIDLRLNDKEIAKLKNIIWYIAHSKLWK